MNGSPPLVTPLRGVTHLPGAPRHGRKRDAEHRRRARKRMIADERGLGPSIRRLRLLRGVRQEDFAGITARTVARIERGDVSKPQQATLRSIADALGVTVDHLGAF